MAFSTDVKVFLWYTLESGMSWDIHTFKDAEYSQAAFPIGFPVHIYQSGVKISKCSTPC